MNNKIINNTLNKVAVLLGGTSSEREVSLKSGNAVLTALKELGINAHGIDTKDYEITKLKQDGFTSAFIALHGRGGEDGVTQAILEHQKIPYTGSKVLASALAMDKLKTKQIWQANNLPTAKYKVIEKNQLVDIEQIVNELNLPLFIKPSREGSSVGMNKVTSIEELQPAIEHAFIYDNKILIESFLAGDEYSVPIVGDKVLSAIKIKPTAQFYDYEAKYLSNSTQYFCPCGLDKCKEDAVKKLALKAYQVIGCDGWGRVDIMFDSNDNPFLLEVNTSPGMTSHSLVPMAAKQDNTSFNELVYQILMMASI